MPQGLNVRSEIGTLRKVMLHRPGGELLNLSPDNLAPLLFDDIPFLEVAQAEHDRFAQMLCDEGVEVLYLDRLVAEALDAHEGARAELTEEFLSECGVGGARFRDAVRERLDDIEDTVSFVDKIIEGVRTDEVDLKASRSMSLADVMLTGKNTDSEILVDPIPNTYFTRDTFSVIGGGVSINRMRFETRRRESLLGTYLFRYHPEYAGVPLWYDRDLPYHIEGGDILVLGPTVIGIGISERTQPAAIDCIARRLLWSEGHSGVERVFAFSIPHKRSFMHLDTVCTQVDVDTFTVHPGILGTLRVFELTRGRCEGDVSIRQLDGSLDAILAKALGLPAVRLIKCGGDDPIASAREQWNDGSNTLAVRPGRVFVYQRNAVTNGILEKAGLELLEIPSAELSRGRGGPHCMSMAFWRDDIA
jgi:arginine deiminase